MNEIRNKISARLRGLVSLNRESIVIGFYCKSVGFLQCYKDA